MDNRILCIVNSLNHGGAETFLMKIFRQWKKNNSPYEMDFITTGESKGVYEDEVEQMGGKIYHVPLRTQHPVKTFFCIYRVIRNHKYHFVLKLCDTPIGVYDILAARLGSAKITSARSCNSFSKESRIKNIILQWIRPLFNHLAVVKIAPSDLAARFTFGAQAVERGDVHFVHNGLDVDVFRYKEKHREDIRREFGLEHNFVVGHVGRFSPQKNHRFLLSVFSALHAVRNDAKLLLVGEGELEEQLRIEVKALGLQNAVIFTGKRADVPALLSAMDVMVFPSFHEGMPNAVIEAQASGLPCVIADTITKQAKITDLVTFMPLQASAKEWADVALNQHGGERESYAGAVQEQGYGISDVAERFARLAFDRD